MSLKLRGRNDIAVAELKVLNEEASSIEGLVAADTSQLLVDLVRLQLFSTTAARR
jgi:hypothetical protein